MVNMMKRNDLEKLHLEYPEARQMHFNNKGFDYLMPNKAGQMFKVEYKCRSLGVKYDISPSQVFEPDIFTLRIKDTHKHYHMSSSTYRKISKRHSAIDSGWTGKALELSQKKFIENSTTDLRALVETLEFEGVDLTEFFA